MRTGLLACLALVLVGVVGCAGQPRETVDISRDPSWIPPGQGDLAIADTPGPSAKPPKPRRARSLQPPNHRAVPAHLVQVGKKTSANP